MILSHLSEYCTYSCQLKSKTIILIAGPTAVGKTALAVEIAKKLNTEIISADSRQCYRELNIGVAKPDALQLQEVKHHFINSHSIHENLNAAVFEKYALNAVQDIFHRHDVAVLVGGTGLYIKAFCEGLDEIPAVAPGIRNIIKENFNQSGISWLQDQLRIHDPVYFSTAEIHNPQRLMRALEVKLGTGRSIRDFQQNKKSSRDFNLVKIGLHLPREQHHEFINTRVDEMVTRGLIHEVENLLPYKSFAALQTVGYAEIFAYFDRKLVLEEAIEQVKKNTRHYAKRQLTWFRKDTTIQWYTPFDKEKILDLYQAFL